MKLLFLNHNVAWSGTFFRAYHLARELTARGHDVTVVTTSRTARFGVQREVRNGVQLVEMPDLFWGRGRTGWDPWNILNRTALLPSQQVDLVHAFDCRPAVILPALLAKRTGVPLFIDWADWWGRGGTIEERDGWLINKLIGGVETWFEESFRQYAIANTVISRALEQRVVELGAQGDRVFRFPHGCDVANLQAQERPPARERLGLPLHERLVVHLGQVYPGDLALLLDAMRTVIAEVPQSRLVMLGNPRAPILPEAFPQAHLVLPGFVDFATLQLWLAAADVCVIPLRDTVSGRGRWPSKINDYFAAARAVVMTHVSDAADVVQSTGSGWTCAANPGDFAKTIIEALRSDQADEAGRRGRALAESELNWQTLAERVEGFYVRMIEPAATAAMLVRR